MPSFFSRINDFIRIPRSEESSYTVFWKGAFYGLAILSLTVMTLSGAFFRVGLPLWLTALTTLLIGIVSFWLFRILGVLLHRWVNKIPSFVFALFFGTLATLIGARFIRFGFPPQVFYSGLIVFVVGFTFLFGSSWVIIKKASTAKTLHSLAIIIAAAIIGLSFYFLAIEGTDPFKISFQQTPAVLLSSKGVENPGIKGTYKIMQFTYGSGTDKQRSAFREEIKYKSSTVDASRLLPEWKGSKAKWRQRYWGFGVKEFPLNGRVWMPDRDGKFPIILIVHGNHGMEEHSDPGYGYLGELLASRGFITVSVDENFINGTWSGDFMGKEMPTRAWLLLKHLDQWKTWSNDSTHELFHKADLENVILAGHSRGGEAAPIAAHFNELKYFPDNANEEFDFGFAIKGVVAIAPTDKRYDRRIKLENTNYLSIQGSYDSDEASFFGFRQYQRVAFKDSVFYFKSGLYVHGANHGQFNSVWGKYDGGPPGKWLLNTAPMMTQVDQQQIAKVYISAFAEAVLHGKKVYLDMFKNAAVAADWLPKEILLNTYKDTNTKELVTFEEDIDVSTGTIEGSRLRAINLKVWKETTLKFRDKDTQANNAVILGWAKDSTAAIGSFRLSLANSIDIDSTSSLFLTMAQGSLQELELKKDQTDKKDEVEQVELNFRVQLVDSLGNESWLEINNIKKMTPQLKVQFVKLPGLNKENFGDSWEPTLETFELPIRRFEGAGKSLKGIKQVNLIFDRSEKGVLILDEISLHHP